ncbi:GNAT family N-acetyltransferase [Dasania marina]|uniref:GNAT family N-acetyltransferase n=1 Tax=Dasania marina TaxID=471499 RepID=UPI0004B4D1B7|nr:GNAT family N-acetyltransferase [Dasania marina]
MTTITIKQVSWQQHGDELQQLRHEVFVLEQNVPPHLEWDDQDDEAYHWLAYNSQQQAIGCARLLRNGAIGRMAIAKQARGKNYGLQLLQAAVEFAQRQLRVDDVHLSAQTHAIRFYQKAGFVAEGDIYDDAGIPHITMRKQLNSQPILGQSAGKFFVQQHQASALTMAQQCRRQLRIVNYDLNPKLFDNTAFCDAVSALARRHRNNQVKLLLVDSRPVVKRGHKLLQLLAQIALCHCY